MYRDKIYVTKGGAQTFEIQVFNQQGDKLNSIIRAYDKIRVTDHFKKEVHRYYIIKFKRGLKWNLEHTKYPEYFPPIHYFTIADSKIYIFERQ